MTIELAVSAASAAIALAAFILSWKIQRNSAALARTQMFLDLRARFLEIYAQLPPFERPAAEYSVAERRAVLAYWHHAFDEWFITNQLSARLMRGLWQTFYVPAVLHGMEHKGFRDVLFEMIDDPGEFSEYRRSFGYAMQKLWVSKKAGKSPPP